MIGRILATALVILVACAAVSPDIAYAQLTDNTFTPQIGNSGNWATGSDWDLGVPTSSHRAIIPQGKTCNVTTDPNPDNRAGAVDVKGILAISSSGKLIVDNDLVVVDNGSGVDGALTLQNDLEVAGELKVESDATLTVDGGDLIADHINIRDTGLMQLAGTLTLTDAHDTRSRIKGTLEVATGTLYIQSNHTIRGDDSGEIHMISTSAVIDGDGDATLTIDGVGSSRADSLLVHGYGDIKALLMNKAYVVADEDGETLYLSTRDKSSTAEGHFMAEGGPDAILYVLEECVVTGGADWELIDESDTSEIQGRIWIDSCLSNLTGDVLNTNGEICLLGNFCTSGDFTQRSVGSPPSEPHIHSKKGAVAKFNVSSASVCALCD